MQEQELKRRIKYITRRFREITENKIKCKDSNWKLDTTVEIEGGRLSILESRFQGILATPPYRHLIFDPFFLSDFKRDETTLRFVFGALVRSFAYRDFDIMLLRFFHKPELVLEHMCFTVKDENLLHPKRFGDTILYFDEKRLPEVLKKDIHSLFAYARFLIHLRDQVRRRWREVAIFRMINILVEKRTPVSLDQAYTDSLIDNCLRAIDADGWWMRAIISEGGNRAGLPVLFSKPRGRVVPLPAFAPLLDSLRPDIDRLEHRFLLNRRRRIRTMQDFYLTVFKDVIGSVEFEYESSVSMVSHLLLQQIREENEGIILEMVHTIEQWQDRIYGLNCG